MVLKVHGGLTNDQFLTGNLRHYSVFGADFSNAISDGSFVIPDGGGPNIDLVIGEGKPVPNSAAAIIINEIEKKATVVITNPTSNGLYFALENDDNDWELLEIQAMIRALGTVGVDGVDVGSVNVDGTAYILYQGNPDGVHTFIELLDTENTYDGSAGYHLVVNDTEDGVIFVPDDSGSSSLVGLSDTSETAVADGYLRWDATGSEVIYEDSISSSNISVDSSGFDGNLSPSDDNLQKALDTVDDLSLSLPSGLTVTIINGQPTLTLVDPTRGDKVLSVSEQTLLLSERRLNNNAWIRIGEANDAQSSFVADFDGTVTGITVHCEDTSGNEKDIHLWVEDNDLGVVANLNSVGGNINRTFVGTDIDIDFSRGDRLRFRAGDTGGIIQDTVIKVTLRWRGQ